MKDISIPRNVLYVLDTLEKAGYAAVLVGGCVRDMIMGIYPHDWDAASAALPDQVCALFPNAKITNEALGSAVVYTPDGIIEVTTFRKESDYSDQRRPNAVTFVKDLDTDLVRRDFTMNAIAMHPSGELTDLFSGRNDIAARRIKTIGDPNVRFQEDALRMLRAFRFSAQLGFEIEQQTLDAIYRCADFTLQLSPDRVREETEKIIMSPRPETLISAVKAGLYEGRIQIGTDCSTQLSSLGSLGSDRLLRWSALCAVLNKCGWISSAEELLCSLNVESSLKKKCSAVSSAAAGLSDDPISIKRLCAAHGDEIAQCACIAADLLYGGDHKKTLDNIIVSGEPRKAADLALKASDLLSIGFVPGPELGKMLDLMLDHVIVYPECNTFDQLKEFALSTPLI